MLAARGRDRELGDVLCHRAVIATRRTVWGWSARFLGGARGDCRAVMLRASWGAAGLDHAHLVGCREELPGRSAWRSRARKMILLWRLYSRPVTMGPPLVQSDTAQVFIL
jgi:hypothetical protein